jgi:protein-tyrosine phosphatase
MHHVTESLLIGNLEDAKRPPPFVQGLLFLDGKHEIIPPAGLAYARIPLVEYAEASPDQVDRAVSWLEGRVPQQKVMICCRAGMGRSASIAIAYLCCVQGMRYQDAVRLVRARRPGATPLPNLAATIESVLRMRESRRDRLSRS